MLNIKTPRDIIGAIQSSKTVGEREGVIQSISNNFISYKAKEGTQPFSKDVGGQDIEIIQSILAGLGYLGQNELSGKLDDKMVKALEKVANKYRLPFSSQNPISKEMIKLFTDFQYGEDYSPKPTNLQQLPKEAISDKYNWPPVPSGAKYLSLSNAQKLYGPIEYKPSGKGDGIIITNNFERDNIVTIEIPQLAKIGKPRSTRLKCHKLAAKQMIGLWQEWENLGLLSRVLTFNGCYYPRFVRGSKTTLSNHAFGVAFDINTSYNGLYVTPPAVGEKGSVRELVPSAYKWGFFWGGHYVRRKDGMHFELSNPNAIQQFIA